MIVVDTSVVYKWIVDEDEVSTRKARAIRRQFLLGKQKVVAPDILLYEIANIFAYKAGLSSADALRAWKNFLRLEIPVAAPTNEYMSQCLKTSLTYRISVYDAAYIVLAQRKKCAFVTADERLVAQTRLPFIRSL